MTTTPYAIIATGKLQDDILEKFDGLDAEDYKMALQDMASGHDPIYQFAGWIWTHDMVIDAYNEYKADVIEAITELASYATYPAEKAARNVIGWQWAAGQQWYSVPETHADFAGRCLAIAITYHAGELFSQVEQ